DLEDYEVKDLLFSDFPKSLDDLDDDDDIENDQEFGIFSSEIEEDIKTKDIDDLVSTIVSPSQTDDPIKMYLKEIGQIDLLTTIQELDLSRKVQDGLLGEERLKLNENNKNKIELTEEEIAEIKDKIEIGHEARAILIESNLRLVVSIAKRYLGRGMQFQDL